MDKNTFNKQTREYKEEQFNNYVINESISEKTYFEVTPLSLLKNYYPETWERPHFHNFYLIIWFKNGNGLHMVDENVYSIRNGRLFFLNPDQLHTFRGYKNINGYVITFSKTIFEFMCPELADYIKYEIFTRQGKCIYCDTNVDADCILSGIMQKMLLECNAKEQYGRKFIVQALLTEFMIQAERLCQWSEEIQRNINSTSYQTYLNFIALVDVNFRTKKEVYWYSKKMGISIVLLSKYVKMYNKDKTLTPLKMINNRIMIEAERVLKYSNDTVSQIAYNLGFKDDSNFVKFFKRLEKNKRTPNQYRKEWNILK